MNQHEGTFASGLGSNASLDELLKKAATHKMTAEELLHQRLSWVRGQVGLSRPAEQQAAVDAAVEQLPEAQVLRELEHLRYVMGQLYQIVSHLAGEAGVFETEQCEKLLTALHEMAAGKPARELDKFDAIDKYVDQYQRPWYRPSASEYAEKVSERVESLQDAQAAHKALFRLRAACRKLYLAGHWFRPVESGPGYKRRRALQNEQDAKLWTEFRDAAGIPEGTATKAGA